MKAQRQIDRIISVITIAAMMITAFTGIAPQRAYAAEGVAYPVTGGNIYFDKDTGAVTGCDDTVTEAVIPAEIEGVAVTKIGKNAFYEKKSLISVDMADSITEIDTSAFNGCSALKNVKLSSNLKIIGIFAFCLCRELKALELPPHLEKIEGGSLFGCTFSTINIPDSLTRLADWDLICTDMTEITLPEKVQVGSGVFKRFKNLKNIYVKEGNSKYVSVDGVLYSADYKEIVAYPRGRTEKSYEIKDGVKEIWYNAFYYAESLKNISIPDSVTHIGFQSFAGSGITAVEIPDMVKEIQASAFLECKSLKAVKLPANLERIYEAAFSWCTSLEEIVIPEGTIGIHPGVFRRTKLKKITLPASIKALGAEFDGCEAFENRQLIVVAPEGSYAYNRAVDLGLPTIASGSIQQTQTITCNSKFSKKLGCEPFNLGASAKTALTYSSSNPAVADVSSDGTVTVKGEGTAVITITAEETPYYKGATKEVTVKVIKQLEQQINAPDSITKITTDSSFKLNATSSEGALSYVSSNTKIAEVSANGTVTIRGAGKAVITVKAAETEKYKPATKEVTVIINKAEQTIKAAADSFVKELKDGSFNLNASAEGVLTYSSNNTSVADVSSAGVVSLKGFGSTVITITATETDKYKTAVKKVNVTVNKPPQTILGADSFTKEFGCGPFGLGASAEGALSYESSNNNIVTVSSSGVVTVKSAGTAVITVIAAETDKYARTTKSVLINIKKDDQDIGGDIAFYKTYGCEPFDLGIIAQGKCTFTSSNVKIASVSDKGIVTVNGAGVAVITITSAETGNYNEAVKTVTVTVEKAAQTIQCKENISKTFSFETFNTGVISATDCIYQSSNEKLVTVNEFGDVTLKNPGKVTVTITAVESDNYKSAVKKITISSKLKKPVIKVKALKGGKARLSWASVPGAKGYKVYIYDKAKKKYVHRLTKKASVKSVIHRGLKKGVTYKYKIRAYRKVNGKTVYSPYSAVKSVKAR